MRKIIITALILAFFLPTFLVVNASASFYENDYEYMVYGGRARIIKYTGFAASLEVPSVLGGYPVTEIEGGAFNDCPELKTLSIPNGIEDFSLDWFEYHMKSSPGMTTIIISEDAPWVRYNSFAFCGRLTRIIVDSRNEDYSSDSQGVLYDKQKTTVIACPKGKSGHVEIPDTVTHIGNGALFNCDGLTSIALSDNLICIDYYSLADCDNLSAITLPNGLREIGYNAFKSCKSLISIDIPNTVTSIGEHAFSYCSSLSDVSLPGIITYIPDDAFAYCTSLTAIDIPDSVESIGNRAFHGCDSLTSITWPKNLKSIGWATFAECDSLVSIDIPDSVTKIWMSAFESCRGLTDITIPDSVTTIEQYAFSNCPSLKVIYGLPGSAAQKTAEEYDGIEFASILVNVRLNGAELSFDVMPRISNDRAMVPMRKIFEELGAEVAWDGDTGTITAKKDDVVIIMQIGNPVITVNGEYISLDVSPYIAGGRTLVPLRAVAESLNADVQWDGETKTVIITS